MKAIGAQDDRLMLKRFGWEKYAHLHKIGRVFTRNPGIVKKRKFNEEQSKRRISLEREMLGHPPI